MKKITTIMALLCAVTVFGQQRVSQHVKQLIEKQTTFRPVAPLNLSAVQNDPRVNEAVSNATLATLNTNFSKDIQQHKYAAIELSLPYNGTTITMQLYRTEVVAPGFHIDTDKQGSINFTPGAYYRGIIKGDPNSIASFSFFDKEMSGIISTQQHGGNIVVGKLLKPGNIKDYVIYSDLDLKSTSSFTCGVNENYILPGGVNPGTGKSALDVQSTRCVTIYFEMDYALYQMNGEDTTAASNWMTTVFNNVQTLYDNDGISVAIKSVFIWTEPDPYSGDSSNNYLDDFTALRPNFDGDIGMLVGIDEGGLGGLAYVDGLCNDNRTGYGDIDFGYSSVPSYSWTVEVITHELGHLCGSRHTQSCVWNGNNTPIDGCVEPEGDCSPGPIPQNGGTIMSYCHLASVGINFANGFGPQPSALILNNVQTSTCLSTDCINTCINTISKIDVIDATSSSVTLHWEDALPEGPWQVGYATGNSVILNWQPATTNTYTVNGLAADKYYRFGVRSLCPAGVSGTYEVITSATAPASWCADPVNGVPFINSPVNANNSNYPNNQHLVRIIKPDSAGLYATVNFVGFDTELDFDFMNIYDGAGVNPSTLIGTFSGNELPTQGGGQFQATNTAGALTFEFISDGGTNATGWFAEVRCTTEAGTKDNSFANLSYYPNPVNGNLTITAAAGLSHVSVYNVAGQLLVQKNVSGTTDVTDMSAYANGVYFFKVSNGESNATLRVIKQ
ncbi:M12 family metallo-peptidase [Flavobacterium sp. RHBU_24]|uniref:M12 family metallo-peptidase n=1 Tax=Flavobacterium sp. RHBU_24 TaxID=3391185 RepID=UPI003984F155